MQFPRMAVVIDQHHGFKPLKPHYSCRLKSYNHLDYYNIRELGQTNLTHSLKQAFEVSNIHRSFSTPCLSLTTRSLDEEFDTTNPRIEVVGGHGNSRVRALVVEVAISMTLGFYPTPLSSGLGGAYLLHGRNGENIAVAKPVDEEPLAFNNPKGFGGLMLGQPGLKRSVRIGENGIRELAAYLLDHGGFSSVPQTALVKISHVEFHVNNSAGISTTTPCKVASLQRFVDHDFDAGELGPSGFSVSSIHRIGIFDILNLDRHSGNILVKKREHDKYAELVPFDHGLCLPEWLDDPYFKWLHWPQASVPFSEIEMEYISNLDPFKDAEILRVELPEIREASIRILVLCTIFLKQAAAAGICLADIGKMMTREFCGGDEELSKLENLCAQAMATMSEDTSGDEVEQCIEGGTIESEQFEFDKESVAFHNYEVLKVPSLLQSYPENEKPPQITEFLAAGSKTRLIFDKMNRDDGDCDMAFSPGKNGSGDDKIRDNHSKAACLTKSKSFAVHNRKCETGVIFFGDMSEDEWEMFLESFEKLLPELFDATKCLSLKQRMGTSCKF